MRTGAVVVCVTSVYLVDKARASRESRVAHTRSPGESMTHHLIDDPHRRDG